jgi:hypothetical protein
LSTVVTNDVIGVETASAYKNVVAIAVGVCEGFSQRMVESASAHVFANARVALFALGLVDMVRLAEVLGGQADTIAGLAGAGDLYVTCLGGRNGRFGQLLGVGETSEQARSARQHGRGSQQLPCRPGDRRTGGHQPPDCPDRRSGPGGPAYGPRRSPVRHPANGQRSGGKHFSAKTT